MLSSSYESWNVPVQFRGVHSDEKLRVSISIAISQANYLLRLYEGWNFNSGNYLFTTDTK